MRAMLTAVHPENLLSFGPKTEPIQLRALNVLIGPNGSGKSNFLEVLRLLRYLPDKDPWHTVLATGGASEWVWKGRRDRRSPVSLAATLSFDVPDSKHGNISEKLRLSVELASASSSFRIIKEEIGTLATDGGIDVACTRLQTDGSTGNVYLRFARAEEAPESFPLSADRSVLSQLASPTVQAAKIGTNLPELFQIAEFFDSFDFHQDWDFGVDCAPREPQPVGHPVARLEENGLNLAQMLAHYRDNYKPAFERLTALVRRFYEPVRHIDIRLLSTHLQIAIEEDGGYSTPASRLSDGMLRWLALLCILLNPVPPPVTCIDEPELGLHPDVIPVLADLLREASGRTQLIVTTHSAILVDALSDEPEAVCVCDKVNGSTVIRRLNREKLTTWLERYSLGQLWTSGQIGGNRW